MVKHELKLTSVNTHRSVSFTTSQPAPDQTGINYVMLHHKYVDKQNSRFMVHPTKVYAWNPGQDLKFGFINYTRPMAVPTNREGINELITAFDPSDE